MNCRHFWKLFRITEDIFDFCLCPVNNFTKSKCLIKATSVVQFQNTNQTNYDFKSVSVQRRSTQKMPSSLDFDLCLDFDVDSVSIALFIFSKSDYETSRLVLVLKPIG